MKQSFAVLLSYLFMSSIAVIIVSAFGTIIIAIRYFVSSPLGPEEIKVWKKFATILVLACIFSPIILHLNRKMEMDTKKRHEDVF